MRKAKHKKQKSRKDKSKTIVVTVPRKFKSTVKFPSLIKAAQKIMRGIRTHFHNDGWPVNYSLYVSDIFYEAHGHHLENYLLNEIFKNGEFTLQSGKGGLLITLSKKGKLKYGKYKQSKHN